MKKNNIFAYGLTVLCLFSLHTLNASQNREYTFKETKELRDAIARNQIEDISRIVSRDYRILLAPAFTGELPLCNFLLFSIIYDSVTPFQIINKKLSNKELSKNAENILFQETAKLTGSSQIPLEIAIALNVSPSMIEEIIQLNTALPAPSDDPIKKVTLNTTARDILNNMQSSERIKILRQQIIYAFATIIKKTPIGTVDPIDIDPKDYPWAKRSIPTFFSPYKGKKNPLPTEKFVDYPTSSDGVFTPRIIFRPTEDILSGTLQTITDGLMDKQREIYDSNIARIKEQRRERFKKLLRKTSIVTACVVGCCFLLKKLR